MMKPMCILGLVLGTALPVGAADRKFANSLTKEEVAAGWFSLFDGETTFGWKVAADARVKDGVLVVGVGDETMAKTTAAFGEFELKFKYRVSAGPKAVKDAEIILGGESLKLIIPDEWANAQVTAGASFTVSHWTDRSRAGAVTKRPRSGSAATSIQFNVPASVQLEIADLKLKPVGLKPIFNGKDLSGWKAIPGHKSEYSVTAKGELNVKNGNGDLQTERQWDDFVLQLEVFSNGPHLNSGVFVRAVPDQFWAGYEAQIRNEWLSDVVLKDGTRLSGSVTVKGDEVLLKPAQVVNGKVQFTRGEAEKKLAKTDIEQVIDHRELPIDYGTGAIYNRQAARKVVSSDYEWFTMTIVAHDNHLAVWVNGYQTADFTDERPANDNARNGSKTSKGAVSLQGHDPTTDLSFRNIRIVELPKTKKE